MRKIVLSLLFVFSAIVFVSKIVFLSSCDTPIGYKIGSIDSRFGITESSLRDYLASASDIWSKTYGKSLFFYDPTGSLTINLVFDERQALTSQIGDIKDQVNSDKSGLNPKIVEYESQVSQFNIRLEKYNADVAYWNAQGGAPQNDYERLNVERDSLQAISKSLNNLAGELNQKANLINSKIGELNVVVNSFNNVIVEKSEEGLFDPIRGTIEIYFSTNKIELIHTLAHEMGHALDMEHVVNAKSIMYAKSNDKVALSDDDKNELARVCKKKSALEIYSKRFGKWIFTLRLSIQYSLDRYGK